MEHIILISLMCSFCYFDYALRMTGKCVVALLYPNHPINGLVELTLGLWNYQQALLTHTSKCIFRAIGANLLMYAGGLRMYLSVCVHMSLGIL